jgi:pSer/pThr/pTyr-binding forkhead associated (FHA) protein
MDAPILRFDRYSPPEARILLEMRALPVGPRVSLEITRGRVRQRIRPVRGRVFLIGTDSDCDLVLGDLAFPESYAYLFVQGARVSIRRLGSGPVLTVCGEQVETADLFHGDCVAFGPFELRVVIDQPSRGRRNAADGCDGNPEAELESIGEISHGRNSPSFGF